MYVCSGGGNGCQLVCRIVVLSLEVLGQGEFMFQELHQERRVSSAEVQLRFGRALGGCTSVSRDPFWRDLERLGAWYSWL